MIAVYIASPYTKGDVAVNVRESFIVADELVKLGYAPFPPLFSHFWHFLSPKPYETWTTLDKEWVLRCDCLLRLPGESSGADAEVALAVENNIPVFYSIGELTAHLPNEPEKRIQAATDPITKAWDTPEEDAAWEYLSKRKPLS